MVKIRRASLCVCGVGLALASCGGDSESGPAIDEIPAKLATIVCQTFPACLGPLVTSVYMNGTDCLTLYTTGLQQGTLPLWLKSIDKGTLKYHPGKVQACLDAIERSGCGFIQDHVYVPECKAALEGTLAEGKGCNHDDECAGDLFCKVDGACPGRCSPRVASAGACKKDGNCQAGMVCFNDLCTTPLQAGTLCNDSTVDCKTPLICIKAANATAGVCGGIKQEKKLGETCDVQSWQLCASGSVCGVTGFNLVAQQAELTCLAPVGVGAECNAAIPSQCPLGQNCTGTQFTALPLDFKGTCTPLPGAGQPCSTDVIFPPTCATGLQCVDKLCVAKANLDAACRYDEECASGKCSGARCVPDDPCLTGTKAPTQ